jgi:hypothetical protein
VRRIYVVVEGGFVTDVCSPDPNALNDVEVVIVNYDIDGEDIARLKPISQGDGTTVDAVVEFREIERAEISTNG